MSCQPAHHYNACTNTMHYLAKSTVHAGAQIEHVHEENREEAVQVAGMEHRLFLFLLVGLRGRTVAVVVGRVRRVSEPDKIGEPAAAAAVATSVVTSVTAASIALVVARGAAHR